MVKSLLVVFGSSYVDKSTLLEEDSGLKWSLNEVHRSERVVRCS